jgi:phosphoenolpyruvate carboxylase
VDLAAVADILASRVVAKADLLLDSVDPAESVVPVVPLLDTVDRVQAAVERVVVRLHRQAVRPSE